MQEVTPTPDESFAVAVIGMACRFPGANTPAQFWHNLRNGVESVTFFTEGELQDRGVDPALFTRPDFVKACPILEDSDLFDAALFGYSPQEAATIDPQQRLFLEVAWESLEDAGYNPIVYDGLIGVYAGSGISSYLLYNLLPHLNFGEPNSAFSTLMNNTADFLATRVSYKLNLKGPSVTVQTACSTSLVATHMACQSLLDFQCDLALAGGVSIIPAQRTGYIYEKENIFSPDGHCRAFDAKGEGTIFGSGVGAVILKRLDEAVRDGDHIYAVIKGSAVNNDGMVKAGFTAPSVEGQANVIAAAMAAANIDATTIAYVEAHGTATPLGDPIEVAALTKLFSAAGAAKQSCALGSVKTNVGHLDAAAGIAGLIKTVKAVQEGEIPPHLHFSQPNPHIDFKSSPFYVNTELRAWPERPTPRRAGVSSFGLGGTNAHLILEEAPLKQPTSTAKPWQLFTLSAQTAPALQTINQNLAKHLEQHPDLNIADVAYTCQVGRQTGTHRRAFVARDRQETIAVLETPPTKWALSSVLPPHHSTPPLFFMFPGAGVHYVNMANALYRLEPTFRQHFDQCASLLRPQIGHDLAKLLYADRDAKDEDIALMRRPSTALPALFTVEFALAQLWLSWGVQPQAMIGHSQGEYVAACLSGVLTLKDALDIVALRGRLFEQVPTGAMLAVHLAPADLQAWLDETLSIAAINGPSLCVVSGSVEAINKLTVSLESKNVVCRRLHIDVAAHSHLITPILGVFEQFLQQISFQEPNIPFLSNVSGEWITPAEATNPSYWVAHLARPVRFTDGLAKMLAEDTAVFLEVGPGQTLTQLTKQHPQWTSNHTVLSSLPHPKTKQPEDRHLLSSLGQLWLNGIEIAWPDYYKNERRHRLSLPTYPFARERYWIDPKSHSTQVGPKTIVPPTKAKNWFYGLSWQRRLLGSIVEEKSLSGDLWILFADTAGVAEELAKGVRQRGGKAICVYAGEQFEQVDKQTFTIQPTQREDYLQLLTQIGTAPTRLIHLWNVTHKPPTTLKRTQQTAFDSPILLVQAMRTWQPAAFIDLLLVTSNVYSVTGTEDIHPEKALILGPYKVIPLEYNDVRCRHIDLLLSPADTDRTDLCADLLRDIDDGQADVVAYRGRSRWEQAFALLPPQSAGINRLQDQGVYLITGGLGGIGLTLATYLAQAVQARLLLVSRRPFPRRDSWEQWQASHAPDNDTSQKIAQLLKLEAFGAEIMVVTADVTDLSRMQEVVRQAETQWGRIQGVIHAAAVAGGGFVAAYQAGEAMTTLAPKVIGLQVLQAVLAETPPDFLILCSSINSFTGGVGAAAYTAANAFLDAVAQARFGRGKTAIVSINWDRWKEVGMMADDSGPPELQKIRQWQSQNAMSSAEGLTAFAHIMANLTWPQVIVATQEFTSLVAHNRLLTLDYYLETFGQIADSHKAYPRPTLSNEYVPPQNAAEEQLVEIWQKLLGISPIGIHDSFFDLGGHSLLGTQVISQIRRQFRTEVPLQLIFEMPTVAELAQYLERENQPQLPSPPTIPAEGYQDETIDQLLNKITGSEKERPHDE